MKFESKYPKGLGGDSISSKLFTISIFSSGGHFVHRSAVLTILVDGHLSNIPMKFE